MLVVGVVGEDLLVGTGQELTEQGEEGVTQGQVEGVLRVEGVAQVVTGELVGGYSHEIEGILFLVQIRLFDHLPQLFRVSFDHTLRHNNSILCPYLNDPFAHFIADQLHNNSQPEHTDIHHVPFDQEEKHGNTSRKLEKRLKYLVIHLETSVTGL